MDTSILTDAPIGFAASVMFQEPPPGDAEYLASVVAAYSALDRRPLPDTTPIADNFSIVTAVLKDELLADFLPMDEDLDDEDEKRSGDKIAPTRWR